MPTENKAQTANASVRTYWGLTFESWLLVAVCMGDAISTVFFVTAGYATEYNPFMAYFLDRSPLLFLFVKILTFLPFIIVCETYRRKEGARAVAFLRWAIGTYVFIYIVMVALVNMGIV